MKKYQLMQCVWLMANNQAIMAEKKSWHQWKAKSGESWRKKLIIIEKYQYRSIEMKEEKKTEEKDKWRRNRK